MVITLVLLAVLPYILALRPVFYGYPIINGITIAKVPRDVAERRLKVLGDRLSHQPIMLRYQNETWHVIPSRLGIMIDYRTSLTQAWRIGRQGSPVKRWKEILLTRRTLIPLKIKTPPRRVREQLYRLTPEIERDPVNASFDLTTGEIRPEKKGRRIDLARTLPRLARSVRSLQKRTVTLVFAPIEPRTTRKELSSTRVRYLVSSFTTKFDPTLHIRAGNIRRGAQQINGFLLPTGKIFSFNKTTGPRDKAHGYGEALEIINERLVPGVGGGICQVSSTLYNAILLAGLKVLERFPHSLPLGYVPPGRDATVYYDRLDLSFKNATAGNLLILAEVFDDRITVALMAEEKPDQRVNIQTEILERIPFTRRWELDETLKPGARRIEKPGQKGIKVRTERWIYAGDQLLRKELLSVDTYKAQPEVVKIGPTKASENKRSTNETKDNKNKKM